MHLYIAAIMDVEIIKGTGGVDDLEASELGGNTVASQIEGNTAAAQLNSEKTSVEHILNKPTALSVEYGKLWFICLCSVIASNAKKQRIWPTLWKWMVIMIEIKNNLGDVTISTGK